MKLTWTWLAVGLLVLLALAAVVRERFTTYEEALRDVGQTPGYSTPSCPEGFTMNSDKTSCERTAPDGTKETADPSCPSGSRYVKQGSRGQCEADPAAQATAAAAPRLPENQLRSASLLSLDPLELERSLEPRRVEARE